MLREVQDRGLCEFVAPVLIVYEVANALKKPPNLFSEREVTDATESILSRLTEIDVPNQTSVKEVIKIAFKHALTIYDASYVALAKDEAILVTGDKGLSTKINSEETAIFLGSSKYGKFIKEITTANPSIDEAKYKSGV